MINLRENQIFNEENVLICTEIINKEEIILKLVTLLKEKGFLDNESDFLSSIYDRESRGTTYVSSNLAIPHGFTDSVKKPSLAIARIIKPIQWDMQEHLVSLVIMFAFPEITTGVEREMEILSKVARSLGNNELVEKLMAGRSEQEIIKTLKLAVL